MEYHETLTATQAMEKAQKEYRNDIRFRRLVDAVAHYACQKSQIDPERLEQSAMRIAHDTSAMMLAAIYDGDAEICRLKEERDQYRKLAEDALALSPVPPVILDAATLRRSGTAVSETKARP